MFCESWRETLSDLALRGVEPSREAQSHLDGCVSCRVDFAEEEQLFAAIDNGLAAAANAEVPASLIPRVRLAIAAEPVATVRRMPAWAFRGVALLLLVAAAYQWRRAPDPAVPKPSATAVTPARAVSPHPFSEPSPHAVTPSEPARSFHSAAVRAGTASREPQILLSGDEQANLLRYLNRLRAHNVQRAAAPLVITDDAQIKPLEIAQIELPELAIEPLENGDSR